MYCDCIITTEVNNINNRYICTVCNKSLKESKYVPIFYLKENIMYSEWFKNETKIWFKSGDLSNEIGIVKSYIGEGLYNVFATDKNKMFVVFQTDIKPFE
jgi:hypothetical protein